MLLHQAALQISRFRFILRMSCLVKLLYSYIANSDLNITNTHNVLGPIIKEIYFPIFFCIITRNGQFIEEKLKYLGFSLQYAIGLSILWFNTFLTFFYDSIHRIFILVNILSTFFCMRFLFMCRALSFNTASICRYYLCTTSSLIVLSASLKFEPTLIVPPL